MAIHRRNAPKHTLKEDNMTRRSLNLLKSSQFHETTSAVLQQRFWQKVVGIFTTKLPLDVSTSCCLKFVLQSDKALGSFVSNDKTDTPLETLL